MKVAPETATIPAIRVPIGSGRPEFPAVAAEYRH